MCVLGKCVLALALILCDSALVYAKNVTQPQGMTQLGRHTEIFQNADCAKTGSCDLKDFSLTTKDYKIDLSLKDGGGTYFGREMFATFHTDTIDHLANYGVAQFIQGCVFRSHRNADGTIYKRRLVVEQNGDFVPYLFPKTQIDGFTNDPLNWGEDDKGGRQGYYFTLDPEFTRVENLRYVIDELPTTPQLWLRDTVDVVHFDPESGEARNISLKFKTCIYRSADVPKDVPRDRLDFAEPLHCVEWQDSLIYNFDTNQFESPQEIDPYCLTADPN